MVLRLREHDTLACDKLRRSGIASGQRHLHGDRQRLSRVLNDLATRRHFIRVETERFTRRREHVYMLFGLLEILLPLLLQVGIDDALERGLIKNDASTFVLERLQQELSQLRLDHRYSGSW